MLLVVGATGSPPASGCSPGPPRPCPPALQDHGVGGRRAGRGIHEALTFTSNANSAYLIPAAPPLSSSCSRLLPAPFALVVGNIPVCNSTCPESSGQFPFRSAVAAASRAAPPDRRARLPWGSARGPRAERRGAPSTMLDPSSSEEESDEGLEEESRDVLVAAGGPQRAPPAPAREGRRDAPGRAGGGSAAGPVSPSPSVLSEGREEPDRQLAEEQERRIRLQLYVFVVRCIAYPFNAKQPTDMARRQQKVSCAPDSAPPAATSSSREFALPGELWGACPLPLFTPCTIFVGL